MPILLIKGHADARPFRNVADLSPFLTTAARNHATRAMMRAQDWAVHAAANGHDVEPFAYADAVWFGSSYSQACREDMRRMVATVAGRVNR